MNGGGRLALFDCDGTLVDSLAPIRAAMTAAFHGAGLAPPDAAAVRRIVGLSLPQAMAVLAPDADHEVLAARYKQAFWDLRGAGAVHEPLFPGIAALLDTLADEGWTLGVATGKSDRGLRLALEAHGIAHRFATLQTADRHPSKPHPAMIEAALAETGTPPHMCAMIGDTSYDMAMARAAGVRALGVAWGYHPAAELVAAGAHAIAGDAGDIPALMLEPA